MEFRDIRLDENPKKELEIAVRALIPDFVGAPESHFCARAQLCAQSVLPLELRQELIKFFCAELYPALVLRGIGPLSARPTPTRLSSDKVISEESQIYLGLVLSLATTLISYARQQSGRVFNDVLPLADFEDIGNSSHGSRHRFQFHTEDAYHATPPDFLGLICMRNDDEVPTLVSSLGPGDISPASSEQLRHCQFTLQSNAGVSGGGGTDEPRPILFGPEKAPYLQTNLAKQITATELEGRHAIDELRLALDANAESITLSPGDILLINNLRAVHGRPAFNPNYSSGSRWLIRALSRFDVRRVSRDWTVDATNMILVRPDLLQHRNISATQWATVFMHRGRQVCTFVMVGFNLTLSWNANQYAVRLW